MAAFRSNKKKNRKAGLLLPLALFACLIVLFLTAVGSVGDGTRKRQKESLVSALTRDITECYAQEGHYPEDVYYLTQHYGLRYSEDLFYVDYHIRGDNLRPEFTVIERDLTDGEADAEDDAES